MALKEKVPGARHVHGNLSGYLTRLCERTQLTAWYVMTAVDEIEKKTLRITEWYHCFDEHQLISCGCCPNGAAGTRFPVSPPRHAAAAATATTADTRSPIESRPTRQAVPCAFSSSGRGNGIPTSPYSDLPLQRDLFSEWFTLTDKS